MKIIVAGISTEVGKTIVSAILTEVFRADYWKPIQAGSLENSDTLTVKQLSTRADLICHPEAYRLAYPASPHYAAALERVKIDVENIHLPQTKNSLVIEMSGGLLSPLNEQITQADHFSTWPCQWILVVRHYLGSINHTLLSLAYLKQRQLPLLGVIFNGENPASEEFILNYANVPCLGRLKQEDELTSLTIQEYKEKWQNNF